MREQNRTDDWDSDIARVSGEMASRLRARGIGVRESDTPDDVTRLSEGVEEFESAVEAAGGDLMLDEPPSGAKPQPDDERFLLPTRADDESATAYLKRLAAATKQIRSAPQQ